MRIKGRPQSQNIVDLTDPKRRKLGNEDIGQGVGKKLTSNTSHPQNPNRKRTPSPKGRKLNKGGVSKLTT